MLQRKITQKLVEWKQNKDRKALCILGARQIGKTTAVRSFAQENYKVFVEFNFILDQYAKRIFTNFSDVDSIIANITAYSRKSLEIGKTLIFFDEVQACPEVRTAIKFLVEDGRFDYIESGSLLGVKYQDVASYAVGFEEIYNMYPLDFEEFLWANKVQQETILYLKKFYDEGKPVSESVHRVFLKLFYAYLVVGGMPAVVNKFVTTQDVAKVIQEQNDILELYRLDIARYASENDKLKIKSIFDSIPSQLNNKNRRFVLTYIDQKGRQNRYQRSFLWLDAAGVALPCYNVTEPQIPLMLNLKHNLFKLFMSDTGLLCAACLENVQFKLLQGDLDINMGSILENVFAQELRSKNLSLCYFDSKKYGELDFVIQNGLKVDLLEIKSGKDYHKHAALDKVSGVAEWSFGKKIVFCQGNVEVDGDCTYLPWYMIMFYGLNKHDQKMIVDIDISALEGI